MMYVLVERGLMYDETATNVALLWLAMVAASANEIAEPF
jgi:hypothetical protein